MPLQKQPVSINFAQGLDTKTDDKQVAPGKFLNLQNSIFTKAGLLSKRNGFGIMPNMGLLPGVRSLTTYATGLIAVGSQIQAYSSESTSWVNKGAIQNINVDVQPLVRMSIGQTVVDTALASNGLACTVFMGTDGVAYYQVADSVTGQSIVSITAIAAGATAPRVFLLENFFVITYINATPNLRFIAIPLNALNSPSASALITSAISSTTAGYDGVVTSGTLYLAWDGSGAAGIRACRLNAQLVVSTSSVVNAAFTGASLISVCTDDHSDPTIWVTAWGTGQSVTSFGLFPTLAPRVAPTAMFGTTTVIALASASSAGVLTVFEELSVSPTASLRTDQLNVRTLNTAGVQGTQSTINGLGLASKAAYVESTGLVYVLAAYGSATTSLQPTYFLIDAAGHIVAKLAYSNGAGFAISQVLPSLNINGNTLSAGYLVKDLLQAQAKDPASTNFAAVYSQTGINLANFTLFSAVASTSEIGGSLQLSGGDSRKLSGYSNPHYLVLSGCLCQKQRPPGNPQL